MSTSEPLDPAIRGVFEAALALDDAHRGELAARLLDTLTPTFDPPPTQPQWFDGWEEELDRRLAALDAGAPTISSEEMMARLQARIDEVRRSEAGSEGPR